VLNARAYFFATDLHLTLQWRIGYQTN